MCSLSSAHWVLRLARQDDVQPREGLGPGVAVALPGSCRRRPTSALPARRADEDTVGGFAHAAGIAEPLGEVEQVARQSSAALVPVVRAESVGAPPDTPSGNRRQQPGDRCAHGGGSVGGHLHQQLAVHRAGSRRSPGKAVMPTSPRGRRSARTPPLFGLSGPVEQGSAQGRAGGRPCVTRRAQACASCRRGSATSFVGDPLSSATMATWPGGSASCSCSARRPRRKR